jgi:DNA helicase-2/ATP-dependent DNA helicase PcrA
MMTSLTRARRRAQACRQIIGADTDGMLERVTAYLWDEHDIETHAVNLAFLEGGRAEVSPAEGCLFYDAQLDDDPAQKLVVMLHELGHLELHHRLQGHCDTPDPVLGSIYLNDGVAALARYHPRSCEEAEANAFATAFLCPGHEVLTQWIERPQMDSAALARHLGVPKAVIHAQLAEGLYRRIVEPEPQAACAVPPASAAVKGVPKCDASQLAAATCTGCPVLVNAGPGTGKTATLVRRITYLINECEAEPEQLLVLTFSTDAANELHQRIAAHLGEAYAARIEVSTFHGFGVKFLHHHGQFLDLDASASVLDETGCEELVTQLLGTVACGDIVALHHPEETVKQLVRHIGYLKDRLYTPDDLTATLEAWRASEDEPQGYDAAMSLTAMYRAYEAAKKAQQRVDFADLIALPQRLLASHPDLQAAYRMKYPWVMVDEYQDVSRSVAGLLCQLCGPQNPPWVVGDTRQAIYRFRGAAPENVDLFERDFPGAQIFHLDTNYRSSEAVLTVANQLASLMGADHRDDPTVTTHWRYGSSTLSPRAPAVAVVHAESDLAQHEGIAAQIDTWLQQGVRASDMAVLARRNIDVRDISLALGRHGIRATTSGTATPEGVAGDLAAIMTLADQPRASLPRLALALGRGRLDAHTINAVIRQALDTLDESGRFDTHAPDGGGSNMLATEMAAVCKGLRAERFSADAFAMMCAFLFDHSGVLRRTLAEPPSAERTLALSDMATCLSGAAAYRFLHPEAEPRASRVRFAQHFRAALCSSTPSVTPPKSVPEAVRVMTCHAAKGLEFPYVIVAGQTLPPSRRSPSYAWLPPALAPSREEDLQQANALFFVGVTRAQQAVMVTYASSASGRARAGKRELTPLLGRWLEVYAPATLTWPSHASPRQPLTMEAIWGGAPRGSLAVRTLDSQTCAIRTYLEHYLNIRFPVSMPPLYPIFFDAVRRTMGRIVQRAHELEDRVSPEEARSMFDIGWSAAEVEDHPYHDLYWAMGLDYVQGFARAYQPSPKAQQHLGLVRQPPDSELSLRYDLLAHYQAVDSARVAIALRIESLQSHARPDGVLWSGLSAAQRVSFVILQQQVQDVQPWVFSARDGALYAYQWSQNAKRMATEAERADRRFNLFEQCRFETTVQAWSCDRCPVRVSCPLWMGVTGQPLSDD